MYYHIQLDEMLLLSNFIHYSVHSNALFVWLSVCMLFFVSQEYFSLILTDDKIWPMLGAKGNRALTAL